MPFNINTLCHISSVLFSIILIKLIFSAVDKQMLHYICNIIQSLQMHRFIGCIVTVYLAFILGHLGRVSCNYPIYADLFRSIYVTQFLAHMGLYMGLGP